MTDTETQWVIALAMLTLGYLLATKAIDLLAWYDRRQQRRVEADRDALLNAVWRQR